LQNYTHVNLFSGRLSRISDWTKELECEADHLPPSAIKVENAQGFIHTPSYVVIIGAISELEYS